MKPLKLIKPTQKPSLEAPVSWSSQQLSMSRKIPKRRTRVCWPYMLPWWIRETDYATPNPTPKCAEPLNTTASTTDTGHKSNIPEP